MFIFPFFGSAQLRRSLRYHSTIKSAQIKIDKNYHYGSEWCTNSLKYQNHYFQSYPLPLSTKKFLFRHGTVLLRPPDAIDFLRGGVGGGGGEKRKVRREQFSVKHVTTTVCTQKWTDVSTGPLARPFASSLVLLTRSLARFASALRCAHSFACLLTLLTPSLVGQLFFRKLFILFYFLFWPTVP